MRGHGYKGLAARSQREKAEEAANSQYPFPLLVTEISLYLEWQCAQWLTKRLLSLVVWAT